MINQSQEHDMRTTEGDMLWAYLDSGNMFRIIRENRPWDQVTSRTLLGFKPRMVFVCPEKYPNISTDQNSDIIVNGAMFKDIIVGDEVSNSWPTVLANLIIAAREAADTNPLA